MQKELRELIGLHGEPSSANDGVGGPLQTEAVAILQNTLNLSVKTAGDMLDNARPPFALPIDAHLNQETLWRILQSGSSAALVYSEDAASQRNYIGILRTKVNKQMTTTTPLLNNIIIPHQYLATLDPGDSTPLKKLKLDPLARLHASASAITLLRMLQNERSK